MISLQDGFRKYHLKVTFQKSISAIKLRKVNYGNKLFTEGKIDGTICFGMKTPEYIDWIVRDAGCEGYTEMNKVAWRAASV